MDSFRGKDLRDLDHGRFGIPVPKDGKRQRDVKESVSGDAGVDGCQMCAECAECAECELRGESERVWKRKSMNWEVESRL